MPSPVQTSIFRTPAARPEGIQPSPFSYPAVKTVLLFAAGILLSRFLPAGTTAPAAGMILLCLLAAGLVLYRYQPGPASSWTVVLLTLAAGYAGHRFSRGPYPPHHIIRRNITANSLLLMRIEGMPETRGSSSRVRARVLSVRDSAGVTPVAGRVILTIPAHKKKVRYGDLVTVPGPVAEPPRAMNPGAFDYRAWLARQDVHGLVRLRDPGKLRITGTRGGAFFRYAVFPLKMNIIRLLEKHLDDTASPLVQGMLLGMRGTIDREILDDFGNAGVIHLLAVSGLHVGLVMAVFFFLFRLLRLPYRGVLAGTMGMLLFYMILTGMKPSVVRATIMALTILGGQLLERDGRIHNTIAAAALIILAVWPAALFDIGFQLSFAATLGIIILYNKITEWYPDFLRKPESKIVKYLAGAFTVSLAAQLGTAPFTAYYFNKISFISLGVNLLVVPLAFVIICTGFVLLPVAAVIPAAAAIPAFVINTLVKILTGIVGFSAALPGASMPVGTPSVVSVICCLILTVCIVYIKDSVRIRAGAVVCILAWGGILTWSRVISGTDRDLTMTILSADDGSAALVEFPDRSCLLLNSGGTAGRINRAERTVRPFLVHKGIGSIGTLIATSLDEDHIGGAAGLIEYGTIRHLYDTGHRYKSREYLAYARQGASDRTERRTLFAGDDIVTGGSRFTCLHPDTGFIKRYGFVPYGNDHTSMVLEIAYAGRKILWYDTPTPLKDAELTRLGDRLKSDVLICHRNIPSAEIISRVDPRTVIISGNAEAPAINGRDCCLPNQTGAVVIKTGTAGISCSPLIHP